MKEITQEEIREMTGMCRECEINKVMCFCPDCWYGICQSCFDEGEEEITYGKCQGACMDKLPDLGDIEIFKER